MESLLRSIFIDNAPAILLFTFIWVPLYALKKGLEIAIPVLVIRLPIYLDIFQWRWRNEITEFEKLQASLNEMLDLNELKRNKVAGLEDVIDQKLVTLDQKISNINSTIIYKCFPDKAIADNELKRTFHRTAKKLENDLAFLQVLGQDPHKKYNSFLKLNEIQTVSNSMLFGLLANSISHFDFKQMFALILAIKPRIKAGHEIEKLVRSIEGSNLKRPEIEKLNHTIKELEVAVA